MTAIHIRSGQLSSVSIGSDWALVLGGVTPLGRRRAKRAVAALRPRPLDVVWFDATGQQAAEAEGQENDHTGANLVVVDFSHTLNRTLSARLREGGAFRSHRLTRGIWSGFLRPIGGVLQPRAVWKATKRDLKMLRGVPAPVAIVCCDDTAITSAWKASRMWPNSNVTTTIEDDVW